MKHNKHSCSTPPSLLCHSEVTSAPLNHVSHHVSAPDRRLASAATPDTIPQSLKVTRYVGGQDKVEALRADMGRPGLILVHGAAGVGKTARVLEAARPLVEQGRFPGGYLWIDLHTAAASPGGSLLQAMLRALVAGHEVPERADELAILARRLLGRKEDILILVEGAERVPELEAHVLLNLFFGNNHVVWMTRRSSDTGLPHLQGRPVHEVLPLNTEDSLDLLAGWAERGGVSALPAADRLAFESIVREAENMPLFLVWAGRSLHPDWRTTPAKYLAGLHADPLAASLADPDQRSEANARRFMRQALARIRPTRDFPGLPAAARGIFAALAVFHPEPGAPASLLSLATGLDRGNPGQRFLATVRRALMGLGRNRPARPDVERGLPGQDQLFAAARCALLDLGLVRSQGPRPGEGHNEETLHPVHALAASVAHEAWQGRPAKRRRLALSVLTDAAIALLEAPRAAEWTQRPEWLGEMSALALHWQHWLEKAGLDPSSGPGEKLNEVWSHFLEKQPEFQPYLTLKEVGCSGCLSHTLKLTQAYPGAPDVQNDLFLSWIKLGDLRHARRDWDGMENAFYEAIKILQKLGQAHPDVPDFQRSLFVSWQQIGRVRFARRDWSEAEQSFEDALRILRKLTEAHPEVPLYQRDTFGCWLNLGDARASRLNLNAMEQAFAEAMKISRKLVRDYPDRLQYQRDLAIAWERIGSVRLSLGNRDGAEQANAEAMKISQKLHQAHLEVPTFDQRVRTSLQVAGAATP
jgi:tetratricopeptide (TPR) repeat protein